MIFKPLDTTIAYLCMIAVTFFSYYPFLYIFSFFRMDKYLTFALLVGGILTLILFRTLKKIDRTYLVLSRHNIIALFLVMLFGIYALISFTTTGDLLDDTFTLRTLVMVNPIFAILAISCTQNKRDVIAMTTVLSGVYFVFLILAMSKGTVSLSSNDFQNIFIGLELEEGFYQDINVYLGLFVICTINLFNQRKSYLNVISFVLMAVSIIGIFIVGGRAALVALAAVFSIYFFKEYTAFSLKTSHLVKKGMLGVLLILAVIFCLPEITSFLQDSVTWRRMQILAGDYDASKRIYLFTKAIELFLSNGKTVMFGSGINSFPVYISSYSTGMYPHNIVLELLAEYGILGAMIFAISIIYVLYIRKKKLGSLYGNNSEERRVFLFFVYWWVIYSFTGGLRTSWLLVFFSFLLIPAKGISPRVSQGASERDGSRTIRRISWLRFLMGQHSRK